MSEKRKIISIVGATGQQGGGLLRAILADKDSKFVPRAFTRDVNSEKAKALKEKGVEVVQVDTWDENALANAVRGSYGLFCVSNVHWGDPEKESAQIRSMANAARKAAVKHVIWSTLEDSRLKVPLSSNTMPTLFGKYKIPHYDVKGELDDLFADLPTTYLLTPSFFDNFVTGIFGLHKTPDGKYVFPLPMGKRKMAGICADDIGRSAYGIFKDSSYIGRRVGIAAVHLTGDEYAEKLSKAIGKPVFYNPVPFDDFRKFGFPGCVDLANMFQYWHDFADEFLPTRDINETRKLDPELMSFDQYLEKHAKEIKL